MSIDGTSCLSGSELERGNVLSFWRELIVFGLSCALSEGGEEGVSDWVNSGLTFILLVVGWCFLRTNFFWIDVLSW